MIIADPPDFDNTDGTTETNPIARQIYDPAFIMPLPAPTPSSTTTTFITIFTTTTVIFPSQKPSSQPTTITFPSQQPSPQPTTTAFPSQKPSSRPTTTATPSQQPSPKPTTTAFPSQQPSPQPEPFTPLPPSKSPPPPETTTQAIVSFPQHKHRPPPRPPFPTTSSPTSVTPAQTTSSPTSSTPAQTTSSPTPAIQTTILPTPVPTSSPGSLVPTTTPISSLPPVAVGPTLNATKIFGSVPPAPSSQKSSTPSPTSTILTKPPSSSFNSTTSTISSTPPKFIQITTSHINNIPSKPSITSDSQTTTSPITLNNTSSFSQAQALVSESGQTGIQEIAQETSPIVSTQIPVQNSGTPVSTTTPIRASPGPSNNVSPGSSLSIISASTVVSVPSRTSHEPSTTGPVTSQTSSIISSSTSVPLEVSSSSSSASTTRVLGTSNKGFFHKPGAMAGTFIAVGLFLIAGITFGILMCRRRGAGHKYRRLMRGVVDENEIAGLTASASHGSQTNLSMTTGEYHASNQSGSFRGLLEEMEETPRPSLARSRSPLHPPDFSSAIPEAAMSSLVTLPTISNDDDSPVDPIDPFGPHRYSTTPNPFRTPRASMNPYLQNPDIEAAVKWMAANEVPVEREHLVQPTNSDNIPLEPHVREEEVALPAKKTASMSWLEFSSEKTEL